MNQFFFEDIKEGMCASVSNIITKDLISAFAEVSGDKNPIHIDADYAATTQFKEQVAHGALSSSFISAVLGTKLPGRGAIYMAQSVRFLAPVKIGDTVNTTVTVIDILQDKNRIRFETACYVGDKKVVDGEALLYVPSRKQI